MVSHKAYLTAHLVSSFVSSIIHFILIIFNSYLVSIISHVSRLPSNRVLHPLLQYVSQYDKTRLQTHHPGWTARVETVLEYFEIPYTSQMLTFDEVPLHHYS